MTATLSPIALRQAAEWLVQLDLEPNQEQTQAFRAWLAADPQHPAALARLQARLQPLAFATARAALNRTQPRDGSGRARGALGVLLLSAGLIGASYWAADQAYLFADLTATAQEWHSTELPDGSTLELESGSAVDLQFQGQERRVHLLRGAIRVAVAKDPSRPFYVDTPQGSIRALGTRFIVERTEGTTSVSMLESSTRVQSHGAELTLSPGQCVRLNDAGPEAAQACNTQALEQAWDAHQVMASDTPLSQVLDRLALHHKGVLLYDREALAELRVTVMLPADDSDRALRLLARTLPIQVQAFTPWVTRISLAGEK